MEDLLNINYILPKCLLPLNQLQQTRKVLISQRSNKRGQLHLRQFRFVFSVVVVIAFAEIQKKNDNIAEILAPVPLFHICLSVCNIFVSFCVVWFSGALVNYRKTENGSFSEEAPRMMPLEKCHRWWCCGGGLRGDVGAGGFLPSATSNCRYLRASTSSVGSGSGGRAAASLVLRAPLSAILP